MHTFLDLPTTYFVCCVVNLALSLALVLVLFTSRTYPGFRQWVLASTSVFLSMAMLAMLNLELLPPAPATLLINLTFFAHPLLVAGGLRYFSGQPPRNWVAYVVMTLVAGIAIFFTYARPDPNARVFLLSLMLVPLFADCAGLVRRVKPFAHPAIKHSLIATFGLLSAWNLLRVPLGLGFISWNGHGVPAPILAAGTIIILTAANICISIGVILLNFARAQDSLHESEERFRSAMHHSPIGMSLVTLDGRWLEVNPALCAIVGYTREEMLNRDFQSVTHPDDLPADRSAIAQLVARQTASYQREKRYLHKDGRTVWVQVHVSLILTADGRPQYLVSQIVDVTERKKTEQALREHQTKLILAMDAAKLGHWEYEVTAGVLRIDENFCKLLGLQGTRKGGMQMKREEYVRRFIPPEESAGVAVELQRAIETADPHYSRQVEHRFLRADGSTGVMSVRMAIEKDATGRTVRAYGLSQDITEQTQAAQRQRALEEQLRHAQKLDALGTLAGGIAHDFNNILTGIMGNLQLAELELPANHPSLPRLREANRASQRARDHIARVLTFSRRYQGDRIAVPLGPIVHEAVQLLRASLPANIEIRTVIAADCPPVLCDATQIHQVLMNLGTNSAHAMRNTTGLLEISLHPVTPGQLLLEQYPQVDPSHRLRLTVRDTGAGMDQVVLSRLFEPFFTTKAPNEGTGLGLAMVHGIMRDHGGAITIESEVGRGTTFALYFPVATQTARGPAAASNPPMHQQAAFGAGRRIMLVDDDEVILALGRDILRRFGFVPEVFADPLAALRRFESAPAEFAAIISDLTMPGMSGIELARHCEAIRPATPFILSSGYLDADAHGGAQASGVTHFVNKPFDLDEFLTKLRSALERTPLVPGQGKP
ncbi:PAS domain S-box protein [Opitutus sp. GAS368]|jgi:PAS domain S-box-containing protein|uniref:PAS domain S-box protein n=1 Tax=Opitutus sp. GAS368 TaxID=1882749 RepID=UPI00087AE902|nr:PAS domain S-box protein [Opitutus sp. GAS368]SDR66467.1 PAS domain S-box-containing protein [Opitutus sp. GAS368]